MNDEVQDAWTVNGSIRYKDKTGKIIVVRVMEWLDVSFEEEIVTTTKDDPKRTVDMTQPHYDAGGAPVRDQASTEMNRGPTGMNRYSIGMNYEPGVTGNDRHGTGNNRDCTGNNRDGTVAPPGPKQTPTELRRACPGCTRLNRGVAGALPGSDAGIAPLSAVVTVYRGSAGTLLAFTGDQPGHYRRQPGLCRGFTGINQPGVDRDSAGLLTGFNRGGTGKKCDRVKKIPRIIPFSPVDLR
ncbi:hypothetical protein DPMN_164648 [Dreissena polymorpha]|uniref:Uncharacterized protein n=1 Tax=Dreissena polymorpha TaxID=45954 RepID=A0A9D4EVF5_DREPO|nr:hypothetical protein DPMN_164648 [Dreissena polymorpha]